MSQEGERAAIETLFDSLAAGHGAVVRRMEIRVVEAGGWLVRADVTTPVKTKAGRGPVEQQESIRLLRVEAA